MLPPLLIKVVAEILETTMAGSESDLGLSPNGRIKLLKSSSIVLTNPTKWVAYFSHSILSSKRLML